MRARMRIAGPIKRYFRYDRCASARFDEKPVGPKADDVSCLGDDLRALTFCPGQLSSISFTQLGVRCNCRGSRTPLHCTTRALAVYSTGLEPEDVSVWLMARNSALRRGPRYVVLARYNSSTLVARQAGGSGPQRWLREWRRCREWRRRRATPRRMAKLRCPYLMAHRSSPRCCSHDAVPDAAVLHGAAPF